jgi:tRNA uracil 4-sulfurtransferase
VEARGHDQALALVRLSGEVSTKARSTRRAFATRLAQNLRDALASEGVAGSVERRYDRILVWLERPEGARALARVFGLQSLSLAERHPAERLEDVVEAGARLFGAAVVGRRFAVRARRVGERGTPPFRARDVEIALGERLRPAAARVDLTSPEVTVGVEIYEGHAYFFSEWLPGPGGLPLGVEGRAVSLVSGGFDSAVASWQLLRRGVRLDYVFCNLGGATHRLGALRVMKVVADAWSYGARPRLHCVDFAEVVRDLQERAEPRYWQVILKRLMLRAGEAVAHGGGAAALVTGDSLGQVSSQTLQNLSVISEVTRLPILRPLVGLNKEEIIAQARHIGTAPLSAVVQEYCALVPQRPATHAKLEAIREQEAGLDPRLLDAAVAAREIVDLRAVDPEDSGMPELEIRSVPEGAMLIDLRSRAEFASWHYPGSAQLDFPRALAAFPSFGRDRTYVLVCTHGLKSAHLAELMRREGLRAFHFRGGTRALRRLAGADTADG